MKKMKMNELNEEMDINDAKISVVNLGLVEMMGDKINNEYKL